MQSNVHYKKSLMALWPALCELEQDYNINILQFTVRYITYISILRYFHYIKHFSAQCVVHLSEVSVLQRV